MSATDSNPDRFFANLVERLSCALIDIVLIIVLTSLIATRLPLAMQSAFIPIVGGLLYFAGFWSSPLKATPGQFLFRLRVVDLGGNAIDFRHAGLRAALAVGTFAGCVAVAAAPRNELMYAISLFASGLLLLAAITPRRQAAHDLLAGSIVVRAKALKDPSLQTVLDGLAEKIASKPRCFAWIRWGDLIQAMILIGGGAFVMYTAAAVAYQRELRARTGYAISQVTSLKPEILAFYLDNDRLPQSSTDLGLEPRTRYPDGGYFEMESNGTFRIRFEKLPELTGGTISLTPVVSDADIEWQCANQGEWVSAYLPSMCRND